MKKIIASFFLLAVIWMNFFSYIGKDYVQASEYTVIPKEAIRLRILANSNSEADQSLKREIRDRVNENINKWVADLTSLEEGRQVIKSHIGDIEQIVEETLKEENSQLSYKVEFNKNVEFPTKLYGNFVYPAGKYEAVLITLGEGEGANWWCVLFPPLCFLDFSNGDAVQAAKPSGTKEVEKQDEESRNIDVNNQEANENKQEKEDAVQNTKAGEAKDLEKQNKESRNIDVNNEEVNENEQVKGDAVQNTKAGEVKDVEKQNAESQNIDVDNQEANEEETASSENPEKETKVEVKFFMKEWLAALLN